MTWEDLRAELIEFVGFVGVEWDVDIDPEAQIDLVDCYIDICKKEAGE